MRAQTFHTRRPAFSLIELVIVVVIIGIIGAIAIPRLTGAADRSIKANLAANVAILNKAAEMYAAEHGGQSLGREPNGSVSADPISVGKRLLQPTAISGDLAGVAIFGPYLRDMPANPATGRRTIRFGTPGSAISNAGGWIYEEASNAFSPDRELGAAVIEFGGAGETSGVTGP